MCENKKKCNACLEYKTLDQYSINSGLKSLKSVCKNCEKSRKKVVCDSRRSALGEVGKICKICNIDKPLSDFKLLKSGLLGVVSNCKTCKLPKKEPIKRKLICECGNERKARRKLCDNCQEELNRNITEKLCRKCNSIKSLEEFGKGKYCKTCNQEEYYKKTGRVRKEPSYTEDGRKVCSRCKETKNLEMFSKDGHRHRSECKICRSNFRKLPEQKEKEKLNYRNYIERNYDRYRESSK